MKNLKLYEKQIENGFGGPINNDRLNKRLEYEENKGVSVRFDRTTTLQLPG